MKEINIAKNISKLRKKKGLTQEQLAAALSVSPQAVSKWETGTSVPDTQTLPLISEYFDVSIDHLFYGTDVPHGEIYEAVFEKVATHEQQSKESYEDAHKVFAYAHHGVSRGNLKGKVPMRDSPVHISDTNGLSLLSGKGYGAIVTRAFFESVDEGTVSISLPLLHCLSERSRLLVCMAIISMSEISFSELVERLHIPDAELRTALDELIKHGIVVETVSKHKALGYTYEITDTYHTCLCVLIATLEMQRMTLKSFSCCMGYGDYPINI